MRKKPEVVFLKLAKAEKLPLPLLPLLEEGSMASCDLEKQDERKLLSGQLCLKEKERKKIAAKMGGTYVME